MPERSLRAAVKVPRILPTSPGNRGGPRSGTPERTLMPEEQAHEIAASHP